VWTEGVFRKVTALGYTDSNRGTYMEKFKKFVSVLSRFMGAIAGTTLVFVMLLTVLDVILRYFGYPIIGVYDLVALGGGVIIGFSMPIAAEKKVHVFMEMAVQANSRIVKQVLNLTTRLIVFGISFLVAWNLIRLGLGFRQTGEVSLTIKIVYYPIAIGLGVCFFIQMLVVLVEMLQGLSGAKHE
jgi:TRAP-type C4-dicarboxylate transport system permease small subunit